MASAADLRFKAFLSYSHTDSNWAKWLHTRLENFEVGKELGGSKNGSEAKPLYPVFRDRYEFLAGQTLTSQTIQALDASGALIVACSKAAAQSHYVNEEVRLFKSRHPDRPVIPIVIDQAPGRMASQCFPPALSFVVSTDGTVTDTPEHLIAADVRTGADGPELALAKVIAHLLGINVDDVYQRLARQQRRRKRVQIAAGLFLLAAFATTGLAVWANVQKGRTLQEIEAIVKQYTPIGETVSERKQALTDAIRIMVEGKDPRYPVALTLLREGHPKKAIPILQSVADDTAARANQARGEAAAAYRHLGAIAGLSDPKTARDDYRKALEFSPADQEALYWNGYFALLAGDLRTAQTSFERLGDLALQDGSKRDLYRAQLRLGEVLLARGEAAKALSLEKSALAIAETLTNAQPQDPELQRDLSVAQEKLGDLLKVQGDVSGALARYRTSEAIQQRLAKDAPYDHGRQADLSIAYDKIGEAYQLLGEFESALDSFMASLKIGEELVRADPHAAGWQRYVSVSHERIGDALQGMGDIPNALDHFSTSMSLRTLLVEVDPDNFEWLRDLSIAYEKTGEALRVKGDPGAALAELLKSLSIRKHLSSIDPDNAIWQRDLSVSLNKIGDELKAQAKFSEAREHYSSAFQIREKLARTSSENASAQVDLAISYARLAQLSLSSGDKSGALRSFKLGRAVLAPVVERSNEKRWLDYARTLDADISGIESAGVR
jgi:tetratricopeptide (TPR) repeat protein